MQIKNLTGKRFGRLIVIKDSGIRSKEGRIIWECLCDCGNIVYPNSGNLQRGRSRSCGCIRKQKLIKRNTTHNNARRGFWSKEYIAWRGMRARCYQPNHTSYPDYGGRGIRVCDEWLHDFQAFYNHVGPAPSSEHSIDRINSNGDYEPSNVRWADPIVQRNNRRK